MPRTVIRALPIIAMAALVLATLTPTTTRAQPDPAGLFRQFVDAVNLGDVAGALTVFTDVVVWERGGRCPPGACVGTAAVRGEIEKDVADHHRIDIIDIQASDNILTVRVELRTDGTRAAGVERIIQLFTVEVRGDKISSVRVMVDTTDPQTAGFLAARRPPAAPPATGGEPPPVQRAGLPLALLLGSVLILGGGFLTTLAFRRGS